jgi:hypothetical protein
MITGKDYDDFATTENGRISKKMKSKNLEIA